MIEYFDNMPVGIGVRPRAEKHRLLAHGTITAGLIYRVNVATATVATEGFATSSKAPAAGANLADHFVLALESGLLGDKLNFLFKGYGLLTMDSTGIALGTAFTSDGSGKATTVADGDRVLGHTCEAGGANATTNVWFDGIASGVITDSDT
jgi:hypothetical protein